MIQEDNKKQTTKEAGETATIPTTSIGIIITAAKTPETSALNRDNHNNIQREDKILKAEKVLSRYKAIVTHLRGQKIGYYTYQTEEEKSLRVVIKAVLENILIDKVK